MTAERTATCRIGRSRLPTRSDQRPAPRRPRAPTTATAARTRPGVAAVPVLLGAPGTRPRTWRWRTRGTTSSELAACTRQSVGRRYGDAAATGDGLPGDPTAGWSARAAFVAQSTALPAHRPGRRVPGQPGDEQRHQQAGQRLGTASAAPRPWVCASGGITSAAAATPSGRPIWRTPMATPRCRTPNQPITRRPLAALTEAPAAPIRANARPRAAGCDAAVLARAMHAGEQ